MLYSTTVITYILSTGIVLLGIFSIFSLVSFLTFAFNKTERVSFPETKRAYFFKSYALYISWGISLSSLIASLYYSEIAGFPACSLCIQQRFFWYPQVFILLIPFFLKDRRVSRFVIGTIATLSVIGLSIAVYHYYGQVFNPDSLGCDIVAGQSLCASMPFKMFGYITIPMMSLTGFVAQFSLMVWYWLASR